MDAAYVELGEGVFRASPLTVGPWNPEHQHAGPPSALICRAVERAAAGEGLTHLGRLTVNLLRPAPIGECRIETAADYVGRNAGHFSGRLTAGDKEIARFTALMQREEDAADSRRNAGPSAAPGAEAGRPEPGRLHGSRATNSATRDLVENRLAAGTVLQRPLRRLVPMNHPLVKGEEPSPYQRVAVAADSGNGISAALDFSLSFRELRSDDQPLPPPGGEWICLQSRELVRRQRLRSGEVGALRRRGPDRAGEQSLAVRRR